MTLHVVGIGADGWDGLTEPGRSLVRAAEVVLGAPRQLALLPEVPGQRRDRWPSPLRDQLRGTLDDLAAEISRDSVVALASGDPLVAGIGTTLIDILGADAVSIVPAVSSVALARARMGWPAETVEVIRDPGTVRRQVAPGRRILVLSMDASTPADIARTLTETGFGPSRLTIMADLGAAEESITHTAAATWSGDAPPLHVLALECVGEIAYGWMAGLPDEAFEHDGQLTKRDLRASALARLNPMPGQLLWDVGAGAGSVAIEWMRAHQSCRAVAVERSAERAGRIGRNAAALGVPDLRVMTGAAPDALADLPTPDAIFVGGGGSRSGVLDACWSALAPGGRLVVHGVTFETETVLARWHAECGGELTRHSVERATALGGFTGWTPTRAVTQWSASKPAAAVRSEGQQ